MGALYFKVTGKGVVASKESFKSDSRNQLLVKAEFDGQVMQLDMVEPSLECYTWHDFKSKVYFCLGFLRANLVK